VNAVELAAKLRERQENNRPIRVGVIGCGQMGSGLSHAIDNITGMCVSAIADVIVDRGIQTFERIGFERDDIRVVRSLGEAVDSIRQSKVVVTEDAVLLTAIPEIDANVEATGVTEVGARVAYGSIMNRKPIVMLNAETDVTIGYYLNVLARKTGALYTVASGDEPGVLKMLYEQATLMGFKVICLGKGKNNPLNTSITPEECVDEARSKGMNPKMLCSFIDGTKTMVEMAAVANATGLTPDVPGMHGPKVDLHDLVREFVPKADSGILSGAGRVDYSTGKIAPGVFAVVHTDDRFIQQEMKFITHWDGPYYLQFRPYHLCDLETPQSIAEAVLLNEVTVTAETTSAEVVCTAKRDLKTGEKVDGIGGADWYGVIYQFDEARRKKAIPIGIAGGGIVKKPIRKGEILSADNFSPDTTTFVYRLRALQDSLVEFDAGRLSIDAKELSI